MYFNEFNIDNPQIFEKEDELISYFENNIKENKLYDNCKGYISLRLVNAIIKCNFNLRNINLYFNKNKDEFYFNFDFTDIILEGEFNCYVSKHSNIKFHFCYLSFHNVIFEKDVYFSRLKLIGKDNASHISFNNSIFKKDIHLFLSKFYNSNINFYNIIFYGNVDFNTAYFINKLENNFFINFNCIEFYTDLDFAGAIFYNLDILFYEIEVYKKCNFYFSKFISKNLKNKLNISKTKLHNGIDFMLAQIDNNTKFTFNDFNGSLIFTGARLKNKIEFTNNKFYKRISFAQANISKEIIFQHTEINIISFAKINFLNPSSSISIIYNRYGVINNNIQKIYLGNILINGIINLYDIEAEEADFKGSVINGGLINPVNFKVHKFANRESALFLKQQAYAANNAIDALEYKAKEVEKHKEDLIKNWKNNKNLKTLGDILSIELSSIYSDNGQNWVKAFICTILFPSVFFTLSYIDFKVGLYFYILLITYIINILFSKDILKYIINSILVYLIACLLLPLLYIEINNFDKTYIKELFIFLVPTNFEQIKEAIYIYNNNTLFRGFNYFIGKIAFWYGSVQTVTAFRKFAKGA